MEKKRGQKRRNIYFRQTAKAFRAARQTKVYLSIKKNIPYTIFRVSKEKFASNIKKLKLIKLKGSFRKNTKIRS